MSTRSVMLAALGAVLLGALASLVLGALLGPTLGVGIVAGAFIGRRCAREVQMSPVARALAGGSAGVLGILGMAFRSLLIGNQSDNAYLWIMMIGHTLFLPAIVFALVPVVSHAGASRWLLRAAITLFWVLALPSEILLVLGVGLSLSAPEGMEIASRVVFGHLAGAVLLAGALYVVGYFWPRRLTRI